MQNGIVLKSTGNDYWVKLPDNSIHTCKIRGKFRIKGIKTTNPVAVGDEVSIELKDEQYVITKISPRKNYIIRRSVNLSKQYHIIAANIDQAFLIVTITKPETTTSFIDRFLVTAEAYQIPVNIVFNKIDIYSEEDLQMLQLYKEIYKSAGYNCLEISAKENIGISKIKELSKNKISLFSGHSGVGKSTIVNQLDSNIDLKTAEISDYYQLGKHTTTFAEMHELEYGGYIVDTPGIKGFGLVDLKKEEICHYFPEMRALLGKCHFNNCIHLSEPKCAIKEAVERGEIHEMRYYNYITLLEDDEIYR